MPTKWEIKRQASYDTLVRSAARRFHDDGYAATRVEDIVEDTGYSKGAFYFHFTNKLECFWHVIEMRNGQRGEWWRAAEAHTPETTSLEQLLVVVFAGFDSAHDGMNLWVLVMVDFHQQHRHEPDVQARVAGYYEMWVDELAQFVSALQAGGWLDPSHDALHLARQMFAYGEGVRVHAQLYDMGAGGFERTVLSGLVALLEPARVADASPS